MSITTLYGLSLTVRMALSAATGSYGVWDVGLWDTATWGPDVVWVDVSNWVRSLSTNRQIDRSLHGWDFGQATVELNNADGRFSASNMSGPYVTAGVTQIRPWRPVWIQATWAGVTYDLYYGYALTWQDGFLETSRNAGHAIVTVACDDEFASLGRFDGYEQPPVGGGETSGKRIHRILDNAGHTGTRNVDNGVMTMQATNLSANAVTDLKLTADSEGGAVYVDRSGTVVFDNIYALIENTRSNTVQATFGDGGGVELPTNDIGIEYNGDSTWNIAAFARQNGTTVVSADNTSRALYGDKRQVRTDLMCETDTQVQTLADMWVARFKDPEYRIGSVRIKPRSDPARLFPAVLGREVRDLVRVVKRPPGGFTVSQDVFVSGLSFDVTGDDFVCDLTLSSGRPYTSFATSRWDTGRWDSATWFF